MDKHRVPFKYSGIEDDQAIELVSWNNLSVPIGTPLGRHHWDTIGTPLGDRVLLSNIIYSLSVEPPPLKEEDTIEITS